MGQAIWAEPGDVFFTHGEGILARLIRWAESDPGETNGVWANHAGVVVSAGWIVPPEANRTELASVVEALGTVKHHAWWDAHAAEYAKGYRVRVFRPVPPLASDELNRFRATASTYVGDRYGWWKLLFHLADRALFGGRKVLSSLLFLQNRPICSFLAAKTFASVGRSFGMPPQAADPDEMMDYCIANPNQWKEIHGR